jgi:phage portal protein BeeE
MGIFAFGRKDMTQQNEHLFATTIFGSRPAALISEEEALKIPSVKSSVELISSSISTLPIYLYEQSDEDDIQRIFDDERLNVLNHKSNELDTAQVLKRKIVQDYLLHGRAFLYREEGKLYHLEAKNVEITYYTENGFTPHKRTFEYRGHETVTLEESQVIVIDSGQNGVLIDGGKILVQA